MQEVRSGAVTFGHRFLTTSGRAGRAIKVKGFDDYRTPARRELRDPRAGRASRPHRPRARRRGAAPRRAGGRQPVGPAGAAGGAGSGRVSGGRVRDASPTSSCALPDEVLATTMIHHQHFFPLVSAQGALMPAFLAVLNMEPEKPELVARNLERVLTARLRDARFFWDADREHPLEWHRERLSTVAFHKGLGTFLDKAERVEPLARWIAARGLRPCPARPSTRRGRPGCARRIWRPSMVRELTELQGTIGGLYAREDGEPEAVWKAIYHHYLPTAVEADGAPTRTELGAAAVPWAAVALADKLDTVVGMFAAGERPTGSRDPYGIRRAAQGIVRILADLPELTGLDVRRSRSATLVDARRAPASGSRRPRPRRVQALWTFLGRTRAERVRTARRRRPQRPRGDPRRRRASAIARSRRGASSTCCPSSPTRPTSPAGRALQARPQHRAEPRRRRVRGRRAQRQRRSSGAGRAGRARPARRDCPARRR